MTKPGCETFEEIGALVASGAATSEEKRALFAHLPSCADCTQALAAFEAVAASLVQTLPPVAPPPAIRARLLETIAREEAITPVRRAETAVVSDWSSGVRWPWALGWAFAGLFGLILGWNIHIQRENTQLYNAEIASLQLTLAEKEEALRLIEARQTLTVGLSGAPEGQAAGKVFWNPESNAGLLITFDLPVLPPDRVYQLWAIQGGPPVDAGTFLPNITGMGTLKVKPVPNPTEPVTLFAITVEPVGGSPQPTSDILLKGAVSSAL